MKITSRHSGWSQPSEEVIKSTYNYWGIGMKSKLATSILIGAMAWLSIGEANATTYSQNPNLSDFFNGVIEFGIFEKAGINFTNEVAVGTAPTVATITAGYRVVGDANINPIVVSFSSATANIRVFDSIDHYGSAYDGYQYSILGSNDGENFTPLFDPTSVNGVSEPFTLGGYTGTAPTTINNILTGFTSGEPTGYIADFSFGSSYRYYSFGASAAAINDGNDDQELSGVASISPVPEPETYALMLAGLAVVGAAAKRRRKST